MQEKHLTKEDLEDLGQLMGGLLDKQTAVLATKEELYTGLNSVKVELKEYINEGVETIMSGMTDMEKRLDVRERVDKLEKDVRQLKLKHSIT